MSSRRILVVTTVHDPRDARIAVRQIPAMVAAGFEVGYAAAFSARGVQPPADVTSFDLPRSSGRRRFRALVAVRRLLRTEAKAYDLVLLHDPELLLCLVGTSGLPPVVWDVHEDVAASLVDRSWVPRPIRKLVAWLVTGGERLAERRTHLILAENDYQARFRLRHPVIHNFPLVAETRTAPEPGRMVYLGRISRGRGLAEMLAVAQRLRPEGIRLELYGWADEDVRHDVEEAVAAGLVDWSGGYIDNEDALSRARGATAGLSLLDDLPNHRGSMPTKVAEYMAIGLPVVTTPLPRAVELAESHGCGFVVPFGDVAAAAAAVLKLHQDGALRESLSEQGHAAARAHLDWANERVRFIEVIKAWTS